MASDFEYVEVENHKHIFRERSTGVRYSLLTIYDDESVTLLDGDVVEFRHPQYTLRKYSIREQRII